jgi:hypothetical protein
MRRSRRTLCPTRSEGVIVRQAADGSDVEVHVYAPSASSLELAELEMSRTGGALIHLVHPESRLRVEAC